LCNVAVLSAIYPNLGNTEPTILTVYVITNFNATKYGITICVGSGYNFILKY